MGSIRLFLAFAVLMSHADAFDISIIPGQVAVQAFFMISGFYMSLILAQKYKTCSVFVFYTNRLLRLFPTYLFMLFLSFGVLYAFDVGIFVYIDKFKKVFTHGVFMAVLYLWANVAVLGQEMLFLLGIDTTNYSFYWAPNGTASVKAWSYMLVPQAWSLSLELCFYLLAPLILRRSMRWVGAIFILSLALRLFIVSKGPEYDLFLRRFFPAELCLFLIGYFSYFLFTRIKEYRRKYSLGLICWTTLLAVLVFYNEINEKFSLALLAFTMFLSMPLIFNLTKDSRLDRFLGNISYPIYIIHFLIIAVFEEYFEEEYPFILLLLAVFFASLVVYYAIEAPIDRWRQRRVTPLLSYG
ncbi:MAG: acyltransferase [Deltaproteobacteria bacterium]|nr:acyltransferase [Deltaproteobacteria bacterium]